MSALYTTTATVTIYGDETDAQVRGHVTADWGLGMGGGFAAELDGDAEVFVDSEWHPAADFLTATDLERVADALCDMALDDDGRCCAE